MQFKAGLVLLFSIVLGAPALARADAAIALQGGPAPGSGGGTFLNLLSPDINDLGQITFRATLAGGTASEGLFIDPGTGLLPIAVRGDLAPDAGGATFNGFGEPVINGSNFVAFSASLTGGTATWGLFSYFAGTITTIATSQTTAPGTSGGNYTSFSSKIAINDASEVAFVATVGGSSITEGLFVEGAGPGRAVFLIGDPAPAGVAGTYFDFSPPAINDAGNVAAVASFFDPPSSLSSAVVVDEPGGARVAARDGDPAPGTGTGTYNTFNFVGAPAIDAAGHVYFKASVSSGTASDGLFVDAAGTDSAVVLQGDPAPGAGPAAKYLFFSQSDLRTNDAGDLAFSSTVQSGSTNQGLFRKLASGPDEAITLLSDPVPDVPGASFLSLGDSPAIDAFGAAAHRGLYLDAGMGRTGIFLVPEPTGCVSFVVALAALAVLRSSRSRAA